MKINHIYQGDCIEVLKQLDKESIDSIVTDPPYGLEFMGKEWDKLWDKRAKTDYKRKGFGKSVLSAPVYQAGKEAQEFHYQWAKQCLRALKPGGYLLSFGGTRTYHRMACAIEDAGFEIRDMIEWLYGSGFPKSLNIGKAVDKLQGNERKKILVPSKVGNSIRKGEGLQGSTYGDYHGGFTDIGKGTSEWEGWGTALKPAHEPICMARKPLSEKSVAENVLKHKTGGINIDESRIKGNAKKWSKPKGGIFKPSEDNNATLEENSQGRFPANLIHDGSKEVVREFPNTRAGVAVRHNIGHSTKANIRFAGGSKDKEMMEDVGFNDSGSASRFFYCAKASKAERKRGCEGLEEKPPHTTYAGDEWSLEHLGNTPANYREKVKNNHPTVKPIKLMKYLIKMVTPKGGIVLDPFLGSGTTAMAAKELGFKYIGIEKEKEYIKIAKARVKATEKPLI